MSHRPVPGPSVVVFVAAVGAASPSGPSLMGSILVQLQGDVRTRPRARWWSPFAERPWCSGARMPWPRVRQCAAMGSGGREVDPSVKTTTWRN